MFAPISIDAFLKDYIKTNPEENKAQVRKALSNAVQAKKNGATCMQCGKPMWALGSAIVGWNGCFTCITGEADESEDYEIDSVV